MKYLSFESLKRNIVILLTLLLALSVSNNLSGQQTNEREEKNSSSFKKIKNAAAKTTFVEYDHKTLVYALPKPFAFVTRVPSDLLYIAKAPFTKKGLPWLAAVTASSVGLILYDQKITDWIVHTSHTACINPNTSYDVLIKAGNTKVLKLPRNGTTAVYQLGQGATSLFLAGGIWVYGKFFHDYRAAATASDLAETFTTMAITTQVIKRITGRESPFESSATGGRWKAFPSFRKFQNDTPKYDAFPSGHLATLMATVTVLADNYPEKRWIKPVGYSLAGLCMWTMSDIKVHWVGDYPLALAIGYLSGKITAMKHQKTGKTKLPVFND